MGPIRPILGPNLVTQPADVHSDPVTELSDLAFMAPDGTHNERFFLKLANQNELSADLKCPIFFLFTDNLVDFGYNLKSLCL